MGIGKYQVHLRVVPRHHLLVCIPAATDHASDIATQPRIVLDQVLAIECESRVQYHDVRLGTLISPETSVTVFDPDRHSTASAAE